jgi:CCR4-NOT transcription complex subunit 1
LSTNFPTFLEILSRPDIEAYANLSPQSIALIIDRFLQYHPPNFNAASRRDLHTAVANRFAAMDQTPPSEVLAAFDLARVLADRPGNALSRHIQKSGPDFTRDEDTCFSHLQSLQGRPTEMYIGPEQVSAALTFTAISEGQHYDSGVLVSSLRRLLPQSFDWSDVIIFFDQPSARISSKQFLRLYHALLPIAQDPSTGFDIQRLWGGTWSESEAQLSFISAYGSLTPQELDATTIPGLRRSITVEEYANSSPKVQERAAVAVKHPLVSVVALTSIFNVALNSMQASQTVEAKRLFQEVVVPNLDIFLVSALEVPHESWALMATETLTSLFENFLYKRSPEYEFVLDSLWRKDKTWVTQRLIDTHAVKPVDLPLVFEHAVRHQWLEELVYLPNGFGIDLAALAHAEGYLDLGNWARINADRSNEMSRTLLQFLMIKANLEIVFQRQQEGQGQVKNSTTLQVRTVSALLQILEDFLPKAPVPDLIIVQRHCITAYPRLINYGEGFDDIIDANGKDGNALPPAANNKMEEHYKKMYGDELQVRNIVEILDTYKRSRESLDQDVFACMIHGLFDEYNHYVDYPMEALATTAVLFGGIISHRLISDLPLKIGLGMILEAVRDHLPDDAMYKFGLQALMQLLVRFREWPGFCKQLLQIPGLQGTEAYAKAEEALRDHEEEVARGHNGIDVSHPLGFGADQFPNGSADEAGDRQVPAFAALHVEPVPQDAGFEDPGEDAQDKIQFVLNNITESTIQSMSNELKDMVERKHQPWFASHLVEERAKMQPNYHHVYLELINLFQDSSLWAEVLRETYVSLTRMLNSESTASNSTERTHLKNLGGWLGLLTLARDKPIKHRNIAFKQLLIEAHDTKRLIVVIPFVCKVLIQGANSVVFRPPNPWLMDIIHLLIDLYHNAELKLNLKFEIEVLCKGLNLDHKSIEPSGEILNRAASFEEAAVAAEGLQLDQLEPFENLSLTGLGSAVGGGLQAHAAAPTVPDLGPSITIPPTNDMVISSTRLHEIVVTALTRALEDIIQPVVDRSVTIAAISTIQMIRKDFVTEGDENRLRTSAISMVKATAGSLALVTSKEPLRANFMNYMRTLSTDLPSGLPEGTVVMCVNSNIDLACGIIEKQAEERAVPEIEELIERDVELRRRHRLNRPDEPYYEPTANRWSMTMPAPYKLSPNANGLNAEQMAIYEEFGRQPRSSAAAATAHAPSTSDATRSLANEVLQEQYGSIPSLPTPAETPVQHLAGQLQPYPPAHVGGAANGRTPANFHLEMRNLMDRISKLLQELVRVTGEAPEEHFANLPRPHPVIDVVDALIQLIIKASQSSEELALYAVDNISGYIFSANLLNSTSQSTEDNLPLESLVHVLETVRKISGPAVNGRVRVIFNQQQPATFLNLRLVAALIRTDLLDWNVIDQELSRTIDHRKEGTLEFFENLLDLALLNHRPHLLFADFVRSLEAAWTWICEEPKFPAAQRLKSKLAGPEPPNEVPAGSDAEARRRDQMEYVVDEWVQLCNNYNATEKSTTRFVQQIQLRQVIRDRDDFFQFIRIAIDLSVERFEQSLLHIAPTGGEAYAVADAVALLISTSINVFKQAGSRSEFLDSILALITLVLNHHNVKRGDLFNQRVFFRLLSTLLHQMLAVVDDVSDEERIHMVLIFAKRFASLGPLMMPSFAFSWLELLHHRAFLPAVLQLPDNEGWGPYANLLCQGLECLGEQLKAIHIASPAKELYRGVLKVLVIVQHDFPEFIAAHHMRLCASIPSHCAQLLNTVLAANPQQSFNKTGDRGDELKALATAAEDAVSVLRDRGLLELVEQAIQNGPSEDVVAQIAHTIMQSNGNDTAYGYQQVSVDVRLAGAVVLQLGRHGAELAQQNGGPVTVTGREPEVGLLSLLVHELPVVARHYVLASIVNNLRFPNPQTEFFSQVLLHIFGKDMDDPEETEIRQDITRILLERLSGIWPHPWGLMITVIDLLKNEKYAFFDLPFIKADPEVRSSQERPSNKILYANNRAGH